MPVSTRRRHSSSARSRRRRLRAHQPFARAGAGARDVPACHGRQPAAGAAVRRACAQLRTRRGVVPRHRARQPGRVAATAGTLPPLIPLRCRTARRGEPARSATSRCSPRCAFRLSASAPAAACGSRPASPRLRSAAGRVRRGVALRCYRPAPPGPGSSHRDPPLLPRTFSKRPRQPAVTQITPLRVPQVEFARQRPLLLSRNRRPK